MKYMKSIPTTLLLFSLLLLLQQCKVETKTDTIESEGPINIVCTTGMLKDAVENITGDLAQVQALMGPGVDPHLYKATQGDLSKLSEAQIVFLNGIHLEGKMNEVFASLNRRKHVFAIGDSIADARKIKLADFDDAFDPHIWFDVKLWSSAVEEISESLQKVDPAHSKKYQENTEKYLQTLNDLHTWIKTQVTSIPVEQRVMITAHDAFEYFGKAYGVQVRGLQGISTTAGVSVKDVKALVDFITEKKVRALFVESSVPEKALNSVIEGCEAAGHPIEIAGTLFSDAMGAENTPEGNYVGMVKHNVTTITQALMGATNTDATTL